MKVLVLSQKLHFDRILYFMKKNLLIARHRLSDSAPSRIPTRHTVLHKTRERDKTCSKQLPNVQTLISHFWFLHFVMYILRNGGKAWEQNCPVCDFLTYNQLSAHWLRSGCVNMSVKSFNLSGRAEASLNLELAGNNRGGAKYPNTATLPWSNLSFSLYSWISLGWGFQPLPSLQTVRWFSLRMCEQQFGLGKC